MNEANRAVREAAKDLVVEILRPWESNRGRWKSNLGKRARGPPSSCG